MKTFIRKIRVNRLYHLSGFNIEAGGDDAPHLLLTGKNGSGKSVLLRALNDYLHRVLKDEDCNFLDYKEKRWRHRLAAQECRDEAERFRQGKFVRYYDEKIKELSEKIEVEFADVVQLVNDYHSGCFVMAFYGASRHFRQPDEGEYGQSKNSAQSGERSAMERMLKFLAEMKIRGALAAAEGDMEEAENVERWFEDFRKILGEIFGADDLLLEFDYRDYTFHIHSGRKCFPISRLSDGFAAVLDIVADLLLKMQRGGKVTACYDIPGIVIIDEVETHLHLSLQKQILPFLTTLFPNIQFIVSTHSPFVVSSSPGVTAFDMERRMPVTNLTEYSFQALAEGYFGVTTGSGYIEQRLQRLENLLEMESLDASETATARRLLEELGRMPESFAPWIKGWYYSIVIAHSSRVKEIMKGGGI